MSFEHPARHGFRVGRSVSRCAILAFTLTFAVTHAYARAAAAVPPTPSMPVIAGAPLKHRQLQPMRPMGVHSSSGGIAYTIVDLGVPPGSTASLPYAFNNAGLIIGNAVISKKGAVDCELAVGAGKFVDLSATNTATFCFALGLNNVSPGGSLDFVGVLSTEYQAYIPLLGTYATKTGAGSLHVFTSSLLAALSEVNAAGEALGGGTYLPLGWVAGADPSAKLYGFLSDALYVVPAGTTNFDVLQPACIPGQGVPLCASSIGDTCGFGGCEINDAGTILALDSSNGKLMTYTYGSPSSAKDLPIAPPAVNAPSSFINNANQVASSIIIPAGTQAIIYSINTGKQTLIPFLPASSPGESDYCSPMSLNNAGAVLGMCTDQNQVVTYWTWDSKNSLRLLASEIPVSMAYVEIVPLAINDHGQILVQLITPNFTVHWGLLKPISNTVPSERQRHGN